MRSSEAGWEGVMQAEDSDERVETRIQVGCAGDTVSPGGRNA